MIGTTVSHYRVLERLGAGGMGEVYLAEDLRLHRPVALKVLRACEGCEEDERARLLREARIASSLNHPHIAVVYDVEETMVDGVRLSLLAMEYVPGRTLSELAAERPLTFDEILDLAGQAAEALAEAHARGVVHRDVKPSNLMVAQGRLKVLDFGLAVERPRRAGGADETTWSRSELDGGMVAGTLHYLSPEQAMGGALDARTDVFSLGVVLWELLAGRRPFEGETTVAVVDALLHRDPPPLPRRFSDPRLVEVERLLARMLVKTPEARLADLGEARAELARLRAGSRTDAAASAGVASVAVAGFANLSGGGEDDWLGTGLTETVTSALQEIDGLAVVGREAVREGLSRLGGVGELDAERAAALGRLAGARWAVAGGFQRAGEQVRVTGRLVEVESRRVLRSVRTDGRLDAVFELQDRVVAELVSDLRGKVAAEREAEETRVVAAYEALAKGLLNIRADSFESLERAILFFERAVAADPGYVRAHVELGAAYAQKAQHLEAPELHERAIVVLRRALELAPRAARVWRELGQSHVSLGRVDEGLESLRHAHALAPDDPAILAGLARGLFLGRAAFDEAAVLYERAVAANPHGGWYWLQLAHCSALRRDLARAETAARRAIELQEEVLSGQQGVQIVGAYMRLGHALALGGRTAEARDAFTSELAYLERVDHALRTRIAIELQTRLGAAQLALGERERGEAALRTALESFSRRVAYGADDPFTRYYAAAAHALRGETDEALASLAKALHGRAEFTRARLRLEPEWQGLRDDPRFRALLAAP